VRAILLLTLVATSAQAKVSDADAVTLSRCLDDPVNASTGRQTDCESAAAKSYDRRMNVAYAALLRKLPAATGDRLRVSQRACLAFRDAEAAARSALYETRHGTMFAPMQAADETAVLRGRAVQLERYLRVIGID
jgi:uncharacterized protein YecT (DUF1311 family)